MRRLFLFLSCFVFAGCTTTKISKDSSQKENDVALHKDSKLANTLSKLDIGEYIPPELYEVVAEILVFVDDCEKLKGRMMNGK